MNGRDLNSYLQLVTLIKGERKLLSLRGVQARCTYRQ